MLLSACDSKNNKGSQENHLSDKKLSMPAKKEMRGRVGMKATDRMLTFIQADSDSISIEIDNGRIFGELEQGMPVDVAFIDTTLFSDMNATDSNHHHGGSLADLKRVDISATRADYLSSSDPRFKPHQAEVLVKTFVPLKYIVNIDNPDDMR